MTTILSDNFQTRLGTVRIWVETDLTASVLSHDSLQTLTTAHKITVQAFELTGIRLPDGMALDTSKGWRLFIKKTNAKTEQLVIFCKLVNPTSDLESNSNPGEHLDAIEIENNSYHLHIGTEDGERLQCRASESNWMPKRFEKELDLFKSFTEYVDFGFKTNLPNLREGEEIYFHFLVATNPLRRLINYTHELDVSTWYAVDQSKNFLDSKLPSTAGNISLLL